MDMSLVIANDKSAFATQLTHIINAKLDQPIASKMQSFAKLFFEHYPIDELRGHDINDVFGMLYDSYQFISTAHKQRPKIRVFNPSLDDDNWLSNNTVVMVHCREMPFLIDSVRLALANADIEIKAVKNIVAKVERDESGQLYELLPVGSKDKNVEKELLIYLEISRHNKVKDTKAIAASIKNSIADVNLVNKDYVKIINALQKLRRCVAYSKSHHDPDEIYESNQFLAWLMANNFTFLGYAFYQFDKKNKKPFLKHGYGVFSKEENIQGQYFKEFDELRLCSDPLLTFSKSPVRSMIHRRAYPDHITIQAYDERGQFIGVHHLVGLYTSQVYRASVNNIPVVRQKINQLYKNTQLSPNSYSGKVLRQVLETFPRDELFQSSDAELEKAIIGITQINERHLVRSFMRCSADKNFVNFMVYIPRDVFSTNLREKIIDLVSAEVGAESAEFYTYYSESILSRTYIIFKLDNKGRQGWTGDEIELKIQGLVRSWSDGLAKNIIENYGDDDGKEIYANYQYAFPLAYQDNFSPDVAIDHIATISALNAENAVALDFVQAEDDDSPEHNQQLNFKVFHHGSALPLSDIIPILERMNLKVIGEHPYKIKSKSETVWLHDFLLQTEAGMRIDFSEVRQLFQDSFIHIWQGATENDIFNGLVLSAKINWQEVNMLRAYAAYMKQIAFSFSKKAIFNALAAHPEITQKLVSLFNKRFDPSVKNNDVEHLYEALLQELELSLIHI